MLIGSKIVFITAGEWPTPEGLMSSQIFETALAFKARGYNVEWVAVSPLLSYLKRIFIRSDDLKILKQKCKLEGIPFHFLVRPVTLGSPYSMFVRKACHASVAQYLADLIISSSSKVTILHARSYNAAEIGVMAKALLPDKQNVVTSFDMRSTLPTEVGMIYGNVGRLAYGAMKEWEYELLHNSSVSFLPVNIARTHFADDLGVKVEYIPIQGFDRESGWTVDFDKRWKGRKVGYTGSLGQWHDPDLLLDLFKIVPRSTPTLATAPISKFEGLDCRLYKQAEMKSFYDGLLALVIPGLKESRQYFKTMLMRCNLFSTKASEALSRGVPLIVSAELHELASFVRENNCGLVYDIQAKKVVWPNSVDLGDPDFWTEITINAAKTGEMFFRSSVLDRYEKSWEALIEADNIN